MKKAIFFDMDGVLFDSMPWHAEAWEEVMGRHGLNFTAYDCYMQEGRTGQSVIDECFLKTRGRHAQEAEWQAIYQEKTQRFYELAGAPRTIDGVEAVLRYATSEEVGAKVYIVTGSGQQTLFNQLEDAFPGVFTRERMVTAFDYTHGKPDPEPYLMAWKKSGLRKEECMVVENAPLGIRAGKAAGLFTVGVNTGVLKDEDLRDAGADLVVKNMDELLDWLKKMRILLRM